MQVDRNAGGQAMRIDGKDVAYGIGTHANSLIVFDLPPGYTRFKARGGLDNGGTDQGNPSPSSVRFMVFTEPPPAALMAKLSGGTRGSRTAESTTIRPRRRVISTWPTGSR